LDNGGNFVQGLSLGSVYLLVGAVSRAVASMFFNRKAEMKHLGGRIGVCNMERSSYLLKKNKETNSINQQTYGTYGHGSIIKMLIRNGALGRSLIKGRSPEKAYLLWRESRRPIWAAHM